jgi:hypothetical protein
MRAVEATECKMVNKQERSETREKKCSEIHNYLGGKQNTKSCKFI